MNLLFFRDEEWFKVHVFLFSLIITEDEDKDNTSFKESAFSQLVRERIIKGDTNTEVPNLARIVKIVVASIQEGNL